MVRMAGAYPRRLAASSLGGGASVSAAGRSTLHGRAVAAGRLDLRGRGFHSA